MNLQTLDSISRKTDLDKAFKNIKSLVEMNNCHIHLDLIAGLPFDDMKSFANAVNRCIEVKPHMLQLGFLKLLKGSELRDRSNEFMYISNEYPPYQVFKSNCLSLEDIIFLKQIESVIDKFYNTSMYKNSINYALDELFDSPYELFCNLANYCKGMNLKISLKTSYDIMLNFLKKYGDYAVAEHYVKLDCLTYDAKCMLPDAIIQMRDKKAEKDTRHKDSLCSKNLRAEYFPIINKTLLFIYDKKDPIFKSYPAYEIEK